MRRSVLFAVCLGLVLSLLKEAPAETAANTTVTPSSTTTENRADNETDPDPPGEKPPEISGNNTDNVTATETPEVTPPQPSENNTDNVTATETPEVTPPEPSGNNTDNVTATETPGVTPPQPSGNNTDNVTATETPEVTPPQPSGNNTDNVTATETPEVTPPQPSGNNTDNVTATETPEVTPPQASGNNTDNVTATETPEVTPPKPSGNNTDNVTATETPEVTPPQPSGNNTDNVTATETPEVTPPQPSGNNTDNVTATETPEVTPPQPSGNNTDNVTATETPEVTTSEPSGNDTDNVTATETPGVTPSKPSDTSTVNGTHPDATEMPTSAPTDFCLGYPCGSSSATCVSLQSKYICVCEYGYYYSDKSCYKGEVYPATIAVNTPYSQNLEIVNSTEYQELSNKVSAFFKEAFKNLPGYVETVIAKIQPLKQSENRESVPGLNITVTNLFTENSTATADTVSTAVRAAIKNDPSFVNSYEEAEHCDVYECDPKTSVCEGEKFPECKCKPDLEKTKWDVHSCSACSANCSEAKHKYCIQEKDGPTCKCMINFKREAGECVACPVGYSGEECSDNSELILIIVGTVFGAIILCLVIAVSVISVRAKHKQNPEKRSLIRSGYSDMSTSDDRPSMFPRVQTTSGHANPGYQPNNPYEMHSRNRDRFPERDYDDLYEISREPTGFRTQSRY